MTKKTPRRDNKLIKATKLLVLAIISYKCQSEQPFHLKIITRDSEGF